LIKGRIPETLALKLKYNSTKRKKGYCHAAMMLAISRFSNACKYSTGTVIGSKLDNAKNFF